MVKHSIFIDGKVALVETLPQPAKQELVETLPQPESPLMSKDSIREAMYHPGARGITNNWVYIVNRVIVSPRRAGNHRQFGFRDIISLSITQARGESPPKLPRFWNFGFEICHSDRFGLMGSLGGRFKTGCFCLEVFHRLKYQITTSL